MESERIGDFLVRIGAMTEQQVSEVLQAQSETTGTLFGILAIEWGFIDDDALKRYLDEREELVVPE